MKLGPTGQKREIFLVILQVLRNQTGVGATTNEPANTINEKKTKWPPSGYKLKTKSDIIMIISLFLGLMGSYNVILVLI